MVNLLECNDFWADMLLASLYFIAICAVIYLTVKLSRQITLCGPQRKPQKIFLALLFVQSALRVSYFGLTPLYYQTCKRTSMQAPFVLASVFGSLPGFMFLSAFSVLLFTFARIFHTVLRAGQSKHRFTFRVLAVFLILINVGQYSLAGVQYSLDYRNMDDTVVALPIVLVLVFGACVIGILFSVYSVMLYQNYNVLIQNARAEVARSQRAVPPTVYGNTDVQSADVQTTVLVNPMRRLAYAACLTSLCFLARAGFLLYRYYSNSHQEGLSSAGYIEYVAYFFSAEIIPEFLLLVAFNTLIGSSNNDYNSKSDATLQPSTFSSAPSTPLLINRDPRSFARPGSQAPYQP